MNAHFELSTSWCLYFDVGITVAIKTRESAKKNCKNDVSAENTKRFRFYVHFNSKINIDRGQRPFFCFEKLRGFEIGKITLGSVENLALILNYLELFENEFSTWNEEIERQECFSLAVFIGRQFIERIGSICCVSSDILDHSKSSILWLCVFLVFLCNRFTIWDTLVL